MKILLDENIPVKLAGYFSQDLQVSTVRNEGWSGKKNGELLGLMILHDFDVLITMEKNIGKQQNIKRLDLLVIIPDAINNKINSLKPYVSRIEAIIKKPQPKNVIIL